MSESSLVSHITPPPSARIDLITAAVFLAFGLSVVTLSLRMPTFADASGTPFTAPGIVPGFHGIVISFLSVVLGLRSLRRGALRPGGGKPEGFAAHPGVSMSRFFVCTALALLFTIGMIGRMPFWLAVAIFVSAFIVIFEWDPALPQAVRLRRIVTALLVGVLTGGFAVGVFQSIFLVNLP